LSAPGAWRIKMRVEPSRKVPHGFSGLKVVCWYGR
jgi:hypothetical protein